MTGQGVIREAINGNLADWIFRGIAILIIPWLMVLERRMSATEANRYTSKDALIEQREVASHLTEIRDSIANIQVSIAALPHEVPPTWFIDKVEGIEERVRRIETRDE